MREQDDGKDGQPWLVGKINLKIKIKNKKEVGSNARERMHLLARQGKQPNSKNFLIPCPYIGFLPQL